MTYTIPLTHIGKNDALSAGGKGANLGELTTAGFPVPPGFVLTTAAYEAFVSENGLQQQVLDLASRVSVDDPRQAEEVSPAIEDLFLGAEMPQDIRADLLAAYTDLTRSGEIPVAVRSSATAEDLPTASFAGQQDTYLNIRGESALLDAVKKCWASLIRSPEEFDKMIPDTILVCTTATPAWTPLFAQAKGLVTDIGGALAHGSIVAREYGIPAVMGTGVATQRIEDGQRILVDGDAGAVTLLDEVDVTVMTQADKTAQRKFPAKKFALAVGLGVGLAVWRKKGVDGGS